MTAAATAHRPPSDWLALTEAPRAIFEFASFLALRPLLSFLPRGDGHPILVLPGVSGFGYLHRSPAKAVDRPGL